MTNVRMKTPGYIALLDVLGFSAMVAGDRDGEKLKDYLDCLKSALDIHILVGYVEYVVFSDSIVLTTEDDSENSFLALAAACSTILGKMLKQGIALRGAISHGAYFRSKEENGTFIAGRAIIDAYAFEKAQDWVGVMLAPSAIAHLPTLPQHCNLNNGGSPAGIVRSIGNLEWAGFIQPCNAIPFVQNGIVENYDGFAVVPTEGVVEPSELATSIGATLHQLIRLKSLAPDPRSQAKYQRCHVWLSKVYQEISYLANQKVNGIRNGELTESIPTKVIKT